MKNNDYLWNRKWNMIGGAMGASTLALNGLMASYLKRLGGTDYHMALLTSLPSVMAIIGLIPGAIWLEKQSNILKSTCFMQSITRFFLLLFAIVPFLSHNLQPIVFVILMGLRSIPESIFNSAYQTLIGSTFTGENIPDTMSYRTRYSSIANLIMILIAGQIMNIDLKAKIGPIILFQILFVFAFIMGIIETKSYLKLRIPKEEKIANYSVFKNFFDTIKTLHKQKKFILYSLSVFVSYFGLQMGAPLFNIYNLNVVKADETWISYFFIVQVFFQVISVTIWGKLIRKYGSVKILKVTLAGISLAPFLYMMAKTTYDVAFIQIIPGIFGTGNTLALFSILLEVTPKKNRVIYISLFTSLTLLTGFLAPLFGVWIKSITDIYRALSVTGFCRILGGIIYLLCSKKIFKLKNEEII